MRRRTSLPGALVLRKERSDEAVDVARLPRTGGTALAQTTAWSERFEASAEPPD
jgi:hypothetical protein